MTVVLSSVTALLCNIYGVLRISPFCALMWSHARILLCSRSVRPFHCARAAEMKWYGSMEIVLPYMCLSSRWNHRLFIKRWRCRHNIELWFVKPLKAIVCLASSEHRSNYWWAEHFSRRNCNYRAQSCEEEIMAVFECTSFTESSWSCKTVRMFFLINRWLHLLLWLFFCFDFGNV